MAIKVVPNTHVKIVLTGEKRGVWLDGQEIKTALSVKLEADGESLPRVTLVLEAEVEIDFEGVKLGDRNHA